MHTKFQLIWHLKKITLLTIIDTSFSSSWIRFLSESMVYWFIGGDMFDCEGSVCEKIIFPSGS